MSSILKMLLGGLFGNMGTGAATKVTRVIEFGALVAALAPLALWFRNGGNNEEFVRFSLSYGEALVIALVAWWALRVAHRADPPAPPFNRAFPNNADPRE